MDADILKGMPREDLIALAQRQAHELVTRQEAIAHWRSLAERVGGFEVGVAGNKLSVHGALGIIGLLVALTLSALIYVNYQGFQDVRSLLVKANDGHAEMARASNVLACVVSMSPSERTEARQSKTAGALAQWCPWLSP